MGKKYLDETGLKELCNLILADFEKKQDWMQFTTLPDPSLYIGKVVQYTGVTDTKQTKGLFYYSDGNTWNELALSEGVFVVSGLPDWGSALTGVLYFDDISGESYIKSSDQSIKWYKVASNVTKSFEITDTFPDWNQADLNTVYYVQQEDSKVIGYIKDSTSYDSWYVLGNDSDKIKYVDSLPSYLDSDTFYVYPDTDGTNEGLTIARRMNSEVETNEATGALLSGEIFNLLTKYFGN